MKKSIAVLMGGRSLEREISIKSGQRISNALRNLGYEVTKLDVDQNPKTASNYGIMSIPTLIVFKEGKPVSHLVGLRPKAELKQTLDAALD